MKVNEHIKSFLEIILSDASISLYSLRRKTLEESNITTFFLENRETKIKVGDIVRINEGHDSKELIGEVLCYIGRDGFNRPVWHITNERVGCRILSEDKLTYIGSKYNKLKIEKGRCYHINNPANIEVGVMDIIPAIGNFILKIEKRYKSEEVYTHPIGSDSSQQSYIEYINANEFIKLISGNPYNY